jgi:probable rRNA maturation factor
MAKEPNIVISSSQRAIRVPRKRLAALIEFVAHSEGARIGQVDLAVVSSSEISGLNRRFLSHAGPTDVLSFDLSGQEAPGLHAQLVVCGDVAVRQGPLHGQKPQHELMLYVVHGLLHLLGHEDTSIRGGVRMHAREEELLREFLEKTEDGMSKKGGLPSGRVNSPE